MRRLLFILGACAAAVAGAAPAPDETPQLLIVSRRTGSAEIVLLNADGSGEARQLTDGKGNSGYPAWSPDGKKIAFASSRGGTLHLHVMDADGSGVRQLTTGADACRAPAWSPDGKRIAYCRATPGGDRVFVVDADGGDPKLVGDGDGSEPAWSPDGKQILFASARGGRGFGVYVMDADGGNVKELAAGDNPVGFVYPAWSPDGKRIAWAERVGSGLEICVAGADGKKPQQLTHLGGYNTCAAWSPDGGRIAFHHWEADRKSGAMCVIDLSGRNLREVRKDEPGLEGGRPAWRPK
jgi:TolB protein